MASVETLGKIYEASPKGLHQGVGMGRGAGIRMLFTAEMQGLGNTCGAVGTARLAHPCVLSQCACPPAVLCPGCSLTRGQAPRLPTGGAPAPHLRWAAARSFRQVRSPLTAAWCSGRAPSSVSSVAAWPSRSSHSTSTGWAKRAARCSGETPESSWSYRAQARWGMGGRSGLTPLGRTHGQSQPGVHPAREPACWKFLLPPLPSAPSKAREALSSK